MGKHKITMTLDTKSIQSAIDEVKRIQEWIAKKTAEFNKRLAEVGRDVAERGFSQAQYSGVNDVVVEAVPTDKGWSIRASGKAVMFLEFGAGRIANPTEPHPNRPSEIADIGQFGKGQGEKRGQHGQLIGWFYGDGEYTEGNPATLAMWNAEEEIKQRVKEIAKEVFSI